MTYVPGADVLVTGSWDESAKVWNVKAGELVRSLEGHSGAIMSLIHIPRSQRRAQWSSHNTPKAWNKNTGEFAPTLKRHTHKFPSMYHTHTSHTLASSSYHVSDPSTYTLHSTTL